MADDSTFGGGLTFPGGDNATQTQAPETIGADVPSNFQGPAAAPAPSGQSFGAGISRVLPGPHYRAPDPEATALDQTADTLNQRIQRANTVATNPILQFFNPEGVAAARDFVPKATEQLQKIRAQKADMQANAVQAQTLGLAPGEVPDEASMADRVAVAQSKALKGDLRVFKGLQAVDPKSAEAIQDQVHEVVAGHLTKAQLAFDSLSGMQNQGQYEAKLNQLRKDGTLTDLEALGLKVPNSFDVFSSNKAREGQALREARIGVDTVRQKLEERNTYQPMEEKEAKTYNGRLTTAYGDQVTNGTWARNGAAGTRGLVVNGAADPRDLGTKFTLASPDQRKEITEAAKTAVSKEDIEKFRANNRTYELATTDAKGNKLPDGKINTNPNVQQGIAEGLAAMLRGGSGGANVGLLKIETSKRGYVQGLLDSIKTNYAGALNTLSEKEIRPYLTNLTQKQQRDVLDVLHAYNSKDVGDRVEPLAKRAGALGLDRTIFGLGSKESAGVVDDAIEEGRRAQIDRMMPNHQAIGGGDGVFQLNAQRPGVGAVTPPAGAAASTTQLPGTQPLQTPVQQATVPVPPAAQAPQQGTPPAPQPGPAGGAPPAPAAPTIIAGQPVSVPTPPGVSPGFVPALQRIESGKSKDPWTAEADKGPNGKPMSSASGAFQMLDSTWNDNKPAGAPARAKDATPEQQSQAFATLVAKNAQTLTASGLPVNDTNLYVAHNLGAMGASTLLKADPNADARTVVGDKAARNNPLFFRGKPTVATVLERYGAEMNKEPPKLPEDGTKPLPGDGGLMDRIRSAVLPRQPGESEEEALRRNSADTNATIRASGNLAVEHAPAIGSTAGAIGGSLAGPAGTVAGGAAGGGAGQALKDYLQGNEQSPAKIAKEAALGGVLGVGGAARPVLNAAARAVGAGGVEAGAKALEGGDAADIVDAGVKGTALAAGGEAFGRALGMVGHKVFSMFAPDAQKTVREAAAKYATAEETLAKETPKLPSVGGAAGGPNPKYEAAEKARTDAETVLKDAGLKPEEAAYAHKVSSEPETSRMDVREAQASKPGALEQERVGKGYQQLENEVGAAGVGAPKGRDIPLQDGPVTAVMNKKVSGDHAELAGEVEAAIKAPAKDWQEKWVQLKNERSKLLQLERDAENSTAPGKTRIARDMRTLADTVRTQQEKAARYVFGEADGKLFIERLKTLDVRYRRLIEAGGDDIVKAAALKGEAGRDADRKFRAFAHDDPAALAAWDAMRKRGTNLEQGVHDLVAAERIPVVGKVFSAIKLAGSFNRWLRERAAGSPATFESVLNAAPDTTGRAVRDLAGTAAQRGAVMQ